MKFRLGTLAIAAGSLLTFSLVGCNRPVDETGKNTTTPTVNPGTTDTVPAPVETPKSSDNSPAPTPTPSDGVPVPTPTPAPGPTPAVEGPRDINKPADATATPKEEAPKDEVKKEESPK